MFDLGQALTSGFPVGDLALVLAALRALSEILNRVRPLLRYIPGVGPYVDKALYWIAILIGFFSPGVSSAQRELILSKASGGRAI